MTRRAVPLLVLAILLPATQLWAVAAKTPTKTLARRVSEGWVSSGKPDGDVILGEEWLSYWNGTPYWVWWEGPERVTIFDPTLFPSGVYPFWIKKIRSYFIESLPDRPWGACSLFTYKIYGDDGFTLLYESDTLTPSDRSGALPTEWDLSPDSIGITFGTFYAAVNPLCDSHPSSYTDAFWQGYTWHGSPGAWSPFTYGELSMEVYVRWPDAPIIVSVMDIMKPEQECVWVDSLCEVRVRVRNSGSHSEDFGVEFRIQTPPDTEYIDTISVVGLAPGGIMDVPFPYWFPQIYDNCYELIATILLEWNQSPDSVDTMITCTYEYGEIAADDCGVDSWYVGGNPNGPQDALAQRMVPYLGSPFVVTKFKIYVDSGQEFDNVRLCPDDFGVPDFDNPYQTFDSVGAANPPEWIIIDFDTTLTVMTTSDPFWLCAQFAEGADGPNVGVDQDPYMDDDSYWTDDLSTWNPHLGDLFMRVVHLPTVGVSEYPGIAGRSVTHLYQNSPNPASGMTTIRFSLSTPAHASLRIYHVDGSLVRALISANMEPGVHTVSWDGKDELGRDASTGVYFYTLTAANHSLTRKMVIIR